MWSLWDELFRALVLARLRPDSHILLSAGLEMLLAADLQADRFHDALEQSRPGPANAWPLPILAMKRPFLEAHFLLIAADNARDRLTVWAGMEEARASEIVEQLDVPGLKDFRNHQEHLEERFPGGKRQGKSRVRAPGNDVFHVAEGGEVFSANNLVNGRYLMFGAAQVDLQAVAASAVRVAQELLAWLGSQGGNPRLTAVVERAGASQLELRSLVEKAQREGILPADDPG